MLAIRFFAAAMLLAAAPCASAVESSSSSLIQLSLSAPRRQPIATMLLSADSLAATGSGVAATPWAETSTWEPHNPLHSGLAAVYPPGGSTGVAVTLNLLTPHSSGFQAATLPTSLATHTQLLVAPTATQPAATWLGPNSASTLFAKPTLHGTYPR